MILLQQHSLYKVNRTIAYLLLSAIVLQTFHMIEHIVQLHQHAILGWGVKDSSGWIAALNLEEIHWIYNVSYFLLLGIVFKNCSFFTLKERPKIVRVSIILFNFAFVLQGYHVLEHTVRMTQYFYTQCTPCAGILGAHVDGIYLHFVLNFLVFVYPIGVFFALGFHKQLLKLKSDHT